MSLRAALKLAAELGCRVSKVRGTGEARVIVPGRARCVTLNLRKKDAPRVLVAALRQLEERRG